MTSPGPDWVEQARRFMVSSGLGEVLNGGRPTGAADGSASGGPPADHPAECRWCPVCVGVAALQGRRPDVVEGVADVLSTVAAVLRAHAAGGTAHAAGGTAHAAGGTAHAAGGTAHAAEGTAHGAGATTPPEEQHDPPASSPTDPLREETVTPKPDPVQRIVVA
jgi:hypothetical protein